MNLVSVSKQRGDGMTNKLRDEAQRLAKEIVRNLVCKMTEEEKNEMDEIQNLKDKVNLLERQVDWLYRFSHTHDAIGEAVNPSRDYPLGQEEPKKWCEHIKEVKRGASSSIQGFYWGYYKSSGAYPQNICEEWNTCPICGAVKPSEAGEKKGRGK